jgi:Xaa-Pro aminopeptidase
MLFSVVAPVQRVVALKKLAFEQGQFDGYLVFNQSNLTYFTGVQGASALFIPKDDEGTVYVYGVNFEQTREAVKDLGVDLVGRGEDLMTKIARRAGERGVQKLAVDSVGIEGWRSLYRQTKGKIKLKAKPNWFSQLRAVKDVEEIALMRKAAELTSLGMKTAQETIRADLTEIEVAAEIEYVMRKNGSYGTAFETILSSGPASAFPHGGCTERKIRKGDLTVVDIGAVYKNYRSDMTRTFVAGEPSEKQEKIHAIVKGAQDRAFAAIKPGAKTSKVDAAGRQAIAKAGYGEFFVHGLGHGVGLDVHEAPTLNSISKEKLKAGNVVTDEPGIYLVGYGGVRIEDTVLVTEVGAEKLTIGPYGLSIE